MTPKTQKTRRSQLDKDKTIVLIIIAAASIALVAGLMVSKNLLSQATYLSKVADKKEKAVDQLIENKEAIASLQTSYADFVDNNPNLIGGSMTGVEPRDGDNAKLILDALPSKYDYPALISSVEGLLSLYTINSIEGVDDAVNQELQGSTGSPIEMPISLSFTSSYDGFKESVDKLHKSIRPIKIVRLELAGTNNELDTTMDIVSYFQPETGLRIEKAIVE